MGTSVPIDSLRAGAPLSDDDERDPSPGGRAARDTEDHCSLRFMWLSPDLRDARYSGFLTGSGVPGGDVNWFADHYVTAWVQRTPTEEEACVARFSPLGDLGVAPVCNPSPNVITFRPVRVAAGDGGLALAFAADRTDAAGNQLLLVRTDAVGRAVGPARQVVPLADGDVLDCATYDVAWAEDGFGVLYAARISRPGVSVVQGIWLRWFVAE
jgi:hypothetical protein